MESTGPSEGEHIFLGADVAQRDQCRPWLTARPWLSLHRTKHTNWEGGMRAASFVSGGLIPAALRGTSNGLTVHICDWYPTLAGLGGASGKDDPPVAPLAVDMADQNKDIYGTHSFPPVDGVDLWPFLMNATKTSPTDYGAVHPKGANC
jgi:arylsulfatase A-like enzyme